MQLQIDLVNICKDKLQPQPQPQPHKNAHEHGWQNGKSNRWSFFLESCNFVVLLWKNSLFDESGFDSACM